MVLVHWANNAPCYQRQMPTNSRKSIHCDCVVVCVLEVTWSLRWDYKKKDWLSSKLQNLELWLNFCCFLFLMVSSIILQQFWLVGTRKYRNDENLNSSKFGKIIGTKNQPQNWQEFYFLLKSAVFSKWRDQMGSFSIKSFECINS